LALPSLATRCAAPAIQVSHAVEAVEGQFDAGIFDVDLARRAPIQADGQTIIKNLGGSRP
jgi:hypothetical protein